MSDKKQPANNGHQQLQKGYQPSPSKVIGGHQPNTSEYKPSIPQPPPKKP